MATEEKSTKKVQNKKTRKAKPKSTASHSTQKTSPVDGMEKTKHKKAQQDNKHAGLMKKMIIKKESKPKKSIKVVDPDTKRFYATGRRKTSSARVFLKPGSGMMTINGKKPSEYLKRIASMALAYQALEVCQMKNKVDLKITVKGGGESGQAGAIRHGIARVLVAFNQELRPVLKKEGFLSRDSRMVERKKYGLRGARKRFQYSKR